MLKVAVIGCGSISCMHLDPAVTLEEAELVAVCDIRPDRAEKVAQKYNAKPYTDYMEMFEKEQLDVVHICLPHYLHTKVACDAFKKGILFGLWYAFLFLKGYRITFKVNDIPAVFLLRENLRNTCFAPFVRVWLLNLSSSRKPFGLPIGHWN